MDTKTFVLIFFNTGPGSVTAPQDILDPYVRDLCVILIPAGMEEPVWEAMLGLDSCAFVQWAEGELYVKMVSESQFKIQTKLHFWGCPAFKW